MGKEFLTGDQNTHTHIACQCRTVDVVKYLVEFDASCLEICDAINHFPIHHACRQGDCAIVNYLLKKSITSVSERNVGGELPIELLLDANINQDSIVYRGHLASNESLPRGIGVRSAPSQKANHLCLFDLVVCNVLSMYLDVVPKICIYCMENT